MRLPAALELTALEGLKQGSLEGKIKGLERLLVKRFGPLDEVTRKRLNIAIWNNSTAGSIAFWMCSGFEKH